MAAKLKDDDVHFERVLVVNAQGMKKFVDAVKSPKPASPALVRLMSGQYDARKSK